jgi:hypothetical protein
LSKIRLKTGIKRDASFDQNLEGVREACAKYGPHAVIARLEEMITLFYWVKNDEDQKENIRNVITQIEYDFFVLPKLVEEYEITEFVQGPNGSFGTRKRKIKVVVDPDTGEPTPDPLARVIY